MNLSATIDTDGFAVQYGVFDCAAIDELRHETANLADDDMLAGKRNLLNLSARIAQASRGPELTALLAPVLGDTFFPVRGIFFDKTPEKNWPVLWHQDLTIAVEAQAAMDGFGPWSEKNGVPHVQPPESILSGMITARIHLDAADDQNGALRVLPGSHTKGILSRADIETLTATHQAVTCTMQAGDVLLMKPLILHSSPRAREPAHRRVIHIEYAVAELPAPLKWHEKH